MKFNSWQYNSIEEKFNSKQVSLSLTEAYHSRTSSMNLQYPLNILELGLEFSYTSKKNFCTFKNISECQLSSILWCDLLNKSCKTQLIINVIFFTFTVINLSISVTIYHVYILVSIIFVFTCVIKFVLFCKWLSLATFELNKNVSHYI